MQRARDLRRSATAALVAGPFAWAAHDTVTTSVNGLAAAEPGAWWAWPGSVLVAVLAGVVLAGYLAPRGSGRLLDTGCTPCAVVPAASVVGVFFVLDSTPTAGGMVTAAGLLVFALLQRRASAATTCAVPASVRPPVPPAAPDA